MPELDAPTRPDHPAQRVEGIGWHCRAVIEKFDGDIGPDSVPYEVVETDNMLMYGGASCLWQALIGNGSATPGQALTYFNNANAAIGVGDGSAAEAATHTDLQASTNKARKGMNSTYPQHTDGTVLAAASVLFQATFGTSEANFAWAEWGLFNSPTAATGRMLNRKVAALGTKTSASSWQITVTLTFTT